LTFVTEQNYFYYNNMQKHQLTHLHLYITVYSTLDK